MRVFVQPNGMCNGLAVLKSQSGFDVVELNGGTSNTGFDYRVLAKRKYYENDRLTVWPGPIHEFNPAEQADIEKVHGIVSGGGGVESPMPEREIEEGN